MGTWGERQGPWLTYGLLCSSPESDWLPALLTRKTSKATTWLDLHRRGTASNAHSLVPEHLCVRCEASRREAQPWRSQ